MKVKLDENLPAALARVLATFGHDVDTVIDEGLASEADDLVWQATQRASRLLVTHNTGPGLFRSPSIHAGNLLPIKLTP